MAEYKLYDTRNHSVLIDPDTNQEESFDQKDALLYASRTDSYMVIKDSIPKEIRKNIEDHLGKIEYSNERVNDHGHFAIVKDKVHNSYNALKIENLESGTEIQIKSGFPDHKQAYDFVDKQITHDQLQQSQQELSR